MNLLFLSLSICMSLSAMQEHQSDEDDYEYIEFDTSAALKEDQVVPEADYCALPNLPLVILSDYCPVCQHHITLEESIILEACTKEKPGSEPHIFHKSCFTYIIKTILYKFFIFIIFCILYKRKKYS